MGKEEAGQHRPDKSADGAGMARSPVALSPGLRTSKAVMAIEYPLAKPKPG